MRLMLLGALLLPALSGAQVIPVSDLYDNGDVAVGRAFLSEMICQPGACGCKREWVLEVPKGYEYSDVFINHYKLRERDKPGEPIQRLTVSVERNHYDRNTGLLTLTTDANLDTASKQSFQYDVDVTAVLTRSKTGALRREQFNCDSTVDTPCKTTDYFSGDRMWQTMVEGNPLQFVGFAARRVDLNLPNEQFVDPDELSFDVTQHSSAPGSVGTIDFSCGLQNASGGNLPLQCSVDVVGIALAKPLANYLLGYQDTAPGGLIAHFISGPVDHGIFGVAQVRTTSQAGPVNFESHFGGCLRQSGTSGHDYDAAMIGTGTPIVEGLTNCNVIELP